MKMDERIGPTPNGGVRSQIAYFNDAFELVDKTDATQAEITEYDAAGNIIQSTMGIIDRSNETPIETPAEET